MGMVVVEHRLGVGVVVFMCDGFHCRNFLDNRGFYTIETLDVGARMLLKISSLN